MAIKVGDKVKATLKDTTIIGTATHSSLPEAVANPYVEVRAIGTTADIVLWLGDGWKIEVIQDLPTKVGAIIRNNQDGALYVRHTVNTADYYPWGEVGVSFETVWGDDTVAEGGFEILFGGVDE